MRAFKEIVRDGLPAGLQGALFSISNMLIQSAIIGINNTMCPGGSDIIDGNAAACSLEGFAYTATNSVYQAAVTFTSQHFGAGKFKRIGAVMRTCYLVTTIIAFVAAAILLLLRMPLLSLYVNTPLATDAALTRMYIMVIPYFILAWMEVGSGILRGLGKSLTSTIISLIGTCAFRLIWIWTIVPLYPNLVTVYLSYPISWFVTAVLHFTFSLVVRSRYLKQYGDSCLPEPSSQR